MLPRGGAESARSLEQLRVTALGRELGAELRRRIEPRRGCEHRTYAMRHAASRIVKLGTPGPEPFEPAMVVGFEARIASELARQERTPAGEAGQRSCRCGRSTAASGIPTGSDRSSYVRLCPRQFVGHNLNPGGAGTRSGFAAQGHRAPAR